MIMIKLEQLLPIGVFQKTHALKGELNILMEIDPMFLYEDYPLIVDMDGMFVPFYTESVRSKTSMTSLVILEGVGSEEAARKFVNREVYALRTDLMEFFETDDIITTADEFEGFKAELEDGTLLGDIEYIDDSTENLLVHVRRPNGEIVYIPFVDEFVLTEDMKARVIRFSLPEGLLDLNS